MWLFRESQESAETEDGPGAFMLLFILAFIYGDFPQELGQQVLLVGQVKYLNGRHPKQQRKQLGVEDFQHARVEFEEVDLGELPDVVVDGLGQAALEVFEEIGHQGSAAGEVQLSRIFAGAFLVEFTDEVEQQTNQVVLQWLVVWLVDHKRGLLDVVAQNGHRLLHHFEVFAIADVFKHVFLLLVERQLVQRDPHFLGNAHHVIDNYLIEEPNGA